LDNPNPVCAQLAEQGVEEWTRDLPEENTAALLNSNAGRPIRWLPDEGWVEGGE